MKKRRAIRNFVFIGIVLLLLLILTASSFTIPFTDYKFNGFVGGLNRSVDLNGGISATYKVSTADYFEGSIDDARNKAIDRINYLIAKYLPVLDNVVHPIQPLQIQTSRSAYI